MLSNLKNVFKVPDLRNKILFLLGMIALYRLGVAIRVPGIDADAVQQFQEGVKSQGALGFLDRQRKRLGYGVNVIVQGVLYRHCTLPRCHRPRRRAIQ